MRLAVIPPIAGSPFTAMRNYNLFLPQLEHSENDMYSHCAEMAPGFKILDNGVAEGFYPSARQLLRLARKWRVNEVVAQDRLGQSRASVTATNDFFRGLKSGLQGYDIDDMSFMGVVQGLSYDELLWCAENYLTCTPIRTIGVPRNLILAIGLGARALFVQKLRERFDPDVEVHLLGAAPSYILELQHHGASFVAAKVRGVDTSAPFVYALANMRIADGDVASRQERYFHTPLRKLEKVESLIDENVQTLEAWIE